MAAFTTEFELRGIGGAALRADPRQVCAAFAAEFHPFRVVESALKAFHCLFLVPRRRPLAAHAFVTDVGGRASRYAFPGWSLGTRGMALVGPPGNSFSTVVSWCQSRIQPASIRATCSRWYMGSPRATSLALARLRYKWMSCSQEKPVPPST